MFALTRPPADVSNPDVAFEDEPTVTPVPSAIPEEPEEGSNAGRPAEELRLGEYGYSKDRRRFLPASKFLRPPFWRRVELHGLDPARVPAGHGRGQAVPAQEQRRAARDRQEDRQAGVVEQARRAGGLVAAYGNGRIFVTLLSRGKTKAGAVVALDARQTARSSGSACCRRASSPRRCSTTTGSTSAPRTAPSTACAPATARCAGPSRRPAPSSAGSRWPTASSSSATTAAASTRSARPTAVRSGRRERKGAKFGLRSGHFYSTPAVAYGRVYIGNTDGRMYSFSSSNGKLAWTKGTGSYVYASPAVAQVPGAADRLLRLLRRQLLRARRPHGSVRLVAPRRRQDLRRRDRVGDIVYFSNYGKKDTTGLGARTGKRSSTWAAARSTR